MSNVSLNQKLSHIGIRLAGLTTELTEKVWIDIEETLYQASLEVESDSRLFMLLCSWVSVHGKYVVIEKLLAWQKQKESAWLVGLAIFAVAHKIHGWKSLIKKIEAERSLSTNQIARAAIDFKGEDNTFKNTGFLIPKGSLRIRSKDVATVLDLSRENLQYRNRLLIGSNWRSDIITAIQLGYKNPYQIAKATGCSYPSAFYTFKDYAIFQQLNSIPLT